MISLSEWFTRKARRPLAYSVFAAFLLWGVAMIGVVTLQMRERQNLIGHLSGAISVAYSQKNRVILESLISSAAISLKLKAAMICKGSVLILGVNSDFDGCQNDGLETLFLITGSEDVAFKGIYLNLFGGWIVWLTGVSGLLFVLVSFLFIQYTKRSILRDILQPFSLGMVGNQPHPITEFEELREKLNELKVVEQARAIAEAVQLQNRQIAHDIRSPVSALNAIIGKINSIPEGQRNILNSSINRINDIAHTLLRKAKGLNETEVNGVYQHPDDQAIRQIELLPVLVDAVVSEKRVQFMEKIGIEMDLDLTLSYGAFVSINAAELQRAISNIINNSIESFESGKGQVTISVTKKNEKVCLQIRDNGRGIPKLVLAKLGQLGVSHGKTGGQSGSGLGIYHAQKTVEGFGGIFRIDSSEGVGTTVTMTFPLAKKPSWFVEAISLNPATSIVTLDDDLSIHSLWRDRFESVAVENGIEVNHLTFTCAAKFRKWYRENQVSLASSQPLFLVDLELLNQNLDGLQVIEELGFMANSILVTSRFTEKIVLERCHLLGVRLIPKSLVGLVPLVLDALEPKADLPITMAIAWHPQKGW